MSTPYIPTRGIDTYTKGGAAVEIIEIDTQPECPRVLVRQMNGCVMHRDGEWIDVARLYWVELWELSDDPASVPHAEFNYQFK